MEWNKSNPVSAQLENEINIKYAARKNTKENQYLVAGQNRQGACTATADSDGKDGKLCCSTIHTAGSIWRSQKPAASAKLPRRQREKHQGDGACISTCSKQFDHKDAVWQCFQQSAGLTVPSTINPQAQSISRASKTLPWHCTTHR